MYGFIVCLRNREMKNDFFDDNVPPVHGHFDYINTYLFSHKTLHSDAQTSSGTHLSSLLEMAHSFARVSSHLPNLVYVPLVVLLRGSAQKQVSFQIAFTLFHLANITRYLPGRIWGIVRLLSLSQRFGLSKTVVGSSFTLHVGTETAFGGLLATLLIFSQQTRNTAQAVFEKSVEHSQFFAFVGLGFLAAILFLLPTLSVHARQFLKTLKDIGAPLFQKPFRFQWLNIIVSHVLLWCCQGLAFFYLSKALPSFPGNSPVFS